MKLNTDKCYLLLSIQEPNTLKIGDLHINNSLCEKQLGITFDCQLKFNSHIKDICQKTSLKLHVLARLAPYVGATKKRILMMAFFKSQYDYCPLVWMWCNRFLNEQVVKDGSVFIQNFQKLAVEMFKVSTSLSPEVVNELFKFREQIPYELR